MSAGDEIVTELKRMVAQDILIHIRMESLSQREAAEIAGITQPRMSNLCSLYLSKFSLDFLVKVYVDLTGRSYMILPVEGR